MIADVTVRLAVPADAAPIAVMSREYIEHGLPWSWTGPRVLRAIAAPDTNVAVVGPPHAIVAFGIMNYPDEDAHLVLLAVRRARRRQGVGSAMLRWLQDVAVAAGMRRIFVEARRSNLAARNFYCEHGFHERAIQTGMYQGLEDGVRLEKWLGVPAGR